MDPVIHFSLSVFRFFAFAHRAKTACAASLRVLRYFSLRRGSSLATHMKTGRGPYLPVFRARVSSLYFHSWQAAVLSNLRKTVQAEMGA